MHNLESSIYVYIACGLLQDSAEETHIYTDWTGRTETHPVNVAGTGEHGVGVT